MLFPSSGNNLVFADDQAGDGMFLNLNGRGRAYSFECFAFGISGDGDEPLPPLDQSVSCSTSYPSRPRGDSIIFDPSSFQDGGIHEKTALERTSLAQINSVQSERSNRAFDAPDLPAQGQHGAAHNGRHGDEAAQ